MLSILPLTFTTIVETGSITAASDALDMAKSAVSQNLKRLEQQLGVKLAIRTTRRFTLTPAGRNYYARCKELLNIAKVAATEMENFGATPAGPIVITAPHAFISPVIAPAMAEVIALFPDLEPRIIADDQRLSLVAQGIDVSITVGNLTDSSLKARCIGELNDVLCAHPSLLSDSPNNDHDYLKWIQSLPYIAHAREASAIRHQLTHKDNAKKQDVGFIPQFFCNTVESLTAMVRQGLGVALLPDIAIKADLAEGSLVRLLPAYKMITKPIYALHAYDSQAPLSVVSTINACERVLNKNE